MPRIFVNGDSTAYGLWDKKIGGWANRLKMGVWDNPSIDAVVNLALNAQTLDKILERLPAQIAPYGRARNLGVLMLGGADSLILYGQSAPQNPLPDFKAQLRRLKPVLAEVRMTPVFVGSFAVDETLTNPSPLNGHRASVERGRDYTGAVQKLAEEIDAPFVDLADVWTDPTDFISFDGMHPNDSGHQRIADRVIPVVQRRLGEPLLSYTGVTIAT